MISHNRFFISLVFLLCLGLSPVFPSHAETLPPTESTIPNFPCYRDAAALMAKMEDLAEQYPDLMTISPLGSSVDGRQIAAYEIGNKANTNKPHFILLTGLHGNDFSQPEIGLRFAETLLEGYNTNADIRWIVDNIEVDLILLANPDGRQIAEEQAANFQDVLSIKNLNGEDLENNFCTAHPESQGCDPIDYEPETLAILSYLEVKLGTLNPTQIPSVISRDLFVYFSSHNDVAMLPIGKIRIPWFYKPNPSELSELTDPALKWQNELAEMLKVLDPELKGSIQPKIYGDIFPNYPVDYVFRSYGIASLELSAYPSADNSSLECSRFQDNHPEYYLKVLKNMAKSAFQPYKIGYGPIVDKLTVVESTDTEIKYHAEILEKNQIPDQPVRNPITSVHYYIDQPTGTVTGNLSGWQEIDTNPYTSTINFGIPIEGLTIGEHILTLQACSQDEFDNTKEVCGLPLSEFLIVRDPDNPDDPGPPDPGDPDPPDGGDSKIYLPLIGR